MQDKLYDVVVIGSGAGGGTLAARLAALGAEVLVLEGGPKLNTRTVEFPFRHIPTMKPGKPGMDGERSRGLEKRSYGMRWLFASASVTSRAVRMMVRAKTGRSAMPK